MAFPTSPTNGQVALIHGTNYQYNSTDRTWVAVSSSSTGNQGFQGIPGTVTGGNQGFQGYQGVQGTVNQGNQGYQGNQGFQGNQGAQGAQGYQGSQGAQGFQGDRGFQGFQGYQGYQGAQGFQGVQGFQGNQGYTGSFGNQGFQGFQGNQGYQGNQGAGNQGFQGNQGAGNQGFQGNQGAGNQGFQGNSGVNTSLTGTYVGYGSGSNTLTGSSSLTWNGSTLAVAGAITASGEITAWLTSDQRMKRDIVTIDNALEKLLTLNGVTYYWNDLAVQVDPNKKLNVREAGIIAQQVQSVLPEVVITRDNGYLAVNMEKMIPLLIEAIKTLNDKVVDLKQQLNNIKD